MKLDILALDGAFDTGLATVLDAFGTANELAQMQGWGSRRFEVSVVGMRRHVKTALGMAVPVAGARIADHLAHADPLVQRFERWARARLDRGFSLDEAASALATSKRTLARRTGGTLGKSPLAYFQDLGVERAVHLLKTSSDDLDRIAERVGYADGVTLGALLRRKLGRGVREIRGREAA